jgi:hypothetical protein
MVKEAEKQWSAAAAAAASQVMQQICVHFASSAAGCELLLICCRAAGHRQGVAARKAKAESELITYQLICPQCPARDPSPRAAYICCAAV